MINMDRFYFSPKVQAPSEGFGIASVISRCAFAQMKMGYFSAGANFAAMTGRQEDREYCNLQVKYYSKMASCTQKAYALFGDDLINPSINGPKSEALYPLYKEHDTEKAKGKITKIISSNELKEFKFVDAKNPKYLKENKQYFTGICYTQCLEFISDFQKIAHKTITSEDMKSLSEKFTEGGSKRVVRIHSLQSMDFQRVNQENHLLDPVKILETLNGEYLNNLKIDIVGFSVATEIKDEDLPSELIYEEPVKEEDGDPSSSLIKMTDLLKEIDEKYYSAPDAQKYMGGLYNLNEAKVGLSDFTFDENTSDTSNKIMKFADELSIGEYIIHMRPPKNDENILRRGHAIVYIKLENDRYLFDPNLGTVRIPKGKDAEYIKHCLDNVGIDTLYFSRCSRELSRSPNSEIF